MNTRFIVPMIATAYASMRSATQGVTRTGMARTDKVKHRTHHAIADVVQAIRTRWYRVSLDESLE